MAWVEIAGSVVNTDMIIRYEEIKDKETGRPRTSVRMRDRQHICVDVAMSAVKDVIQRAEDEENARKHLAMAKMVKQLATELTGRAPEQRIPERPREVLKLKM